MGEVARVSVTERASAKNAHNELQIIETDALSVVCSNSSLFGRTYHKKISALKSRDFLSYSTSISIKINGMVMQERRWETNAIPEAVEVSLP